MSIGHCLVFCAYVWLLHLVSCIFPRLSDCIVRCLVFERDKYAVS